MTEKWINLKANPKVKKASWNTKNLFIDSDKDGVANIFDCQPYNKRKQDVLMPRSYGNPMREMYNRQAAARQQQIQMKMQKEWALQEAERLRLEQQAQLNQPNVTQAPIITYGGSGHSHDTVAPTKRVAVYNNPIVKTPTVTPVKITTFSTVKAPVAQTKTSTASTVKVSPVTSLGKAVSLVSNAIFKLVKGSKK